MPRTLLGLDVGSSSVKACLLDADTNTVLSSATAPSTELPIEAPQPGFAEQHPHTWWKYLVEATRSCIEQAGVAGDSVAAIGISYQMHGLVCVDESGEVLRPAIIWCDSRAVGLGDEAAERLGSDRCLERLLNGGPGNFTASKLAWVKANEPDLYARIHRFMLPGDWVAYRMSGSLTTTASGLSEGILWDVVDEQPAQLVLDDYGIDAGLVPEVVPGFGVQVELNAEAAADLGLSAGTPVTYRGGDQPNNALSLNVLEPGELAATAGTSGVVYGVSDQKQGDPEGRVNSFVHVNHSADAPRYGVLLCVNGTGICNSWIKREVCTVDGSSIDYPAMNELAASAPVGADGLAMLPFGNGAERALGNRNPGAAVLGLDFNRHGRGHLIRAAQEGIVFALNYGIEGMAAAGVSCSTVRAGHANMFLSPLFASAFASTTGAVVELYDTDGAAGAARGAGIGAGIFSSAADAFASLERKAIIEPDATATEAYAAAYGRWSEGLTAVLAQG